MEDIRNFHIHVTLRKKSRASQHSTRNQLAQSTCTCARNLLKQCAALKGWTEALLQMSPTNLSAQWIPTLYRQARYNADFDVGGHHGQHMPHENGGQQGIAPRDPVGCFAWASSCSVLLKSTNDKHNGTHKHNAQASQYKCHGTLEGTWGFGCRGEEDRRRRGAGKKKKSNNPNLKGGTNKQKNDACAYECSCAVVTAQSKAMHANSFFLAHALLGCLGTPFKCQP